MKLPDPEQFTYKEVIIQGDPCWLITPNHIGTKWNDENARFRSCIVRQSDNFVVSQGFGKFTNFGEAPDFQPWDKSWKFEARHKLDGSLLIVSKYKGELIIRTRGTVDARQMPNGHEIDKLIAKYPNAFDNLYLSNEWCEDCGSMSILFEWTTPNNIIVLREHDEPTLTLVGMVSHDSWIDDGNIMYASQNALDNLALKWGVNRPQKYEYNSIEECINDVAAWRGKEGVVLYSPDGQTLKKIKADEYCELHKLATGIKTINQVLDVFMASPKFTKYSEFYSYIETTLDFEIAEKIKDDILKITLAYSKVVEKLEKVKRIVDGVREGFTRKEQALDLQEHFQTDWRLPIAFQLLDNKPINDRNIRIGIEKELQKL